MGWRDCAVRISSSPKAMQSLVSLLLLALLCAGLTTAKLERLEDRKARYARDANFIHPAEEDRHLTQEEVLKSLPAQARTLQNRSNCVL